MKLHLNLASRTYINRRMLNLAYFAAIGLLALLLFLNGWSIFHLSRHSENIEGMLSRMPESGGSSARPDLRVSADAIAKRVSFANEILKRRRFHWSAFLDRMEATVPEGVKLRSIQPESRGGTVRLEGVARGVTELRRFLEKLSADPALANYYLLEQAVAKNEGIEGDHLQALRFSLQLRGVF